MPILTYLIPVYNEKKTIEKAILQIINLKFKNKEIIVIDNGSTDGSQDLIKQFNKIKNIKIVLRKKNLGFGQSIIQGAKMARGKFIYIHFSDIEYDHNVSLKMLKMSQKSNADAIFGSRLKNKNCYEKILSVKKYPPFLATIIITFLFNLFYKKKFTDVIGSKFYRTSIFKKILLKESSLTWSKWDFEFKNRLISGPYKILEVFTNYKPRENSAKKNVKFYHLFSMIYLIIRFKIKLILSKLK